MKGVIKEIILSRGADICGVAGIERFVEAPHGYSPQGIFSDCKSVVVFGVALPKGLTKINPRLIYGHFNSNSVEYTDAIAFNASKELEARLNCMAIPFPCDSPYEFWDERKKEGKGLLSMKHLAVAAGLGTIGKNSLFLNSRYGNLLTLGAILLDIPIESDELSQSICLDKCTKCIDSCPVHAISGEGVDQYLCRNYTYGKTNRGFDTVDCNQCRTVCPMKFGEIN